MMVACTRVETAAGRRQRRRRLASPLWQAHIVVVGWLCSETWRSAAAASAAVSSKTAAGAAASRYHKLSGEPAATVSEADAVTDTYMTSWDSSPFNLETQSTNNLGMLAKACSQQFCLPGVNGLDLWVSMVEGCPVTSQPRFTETTLREMEGEQADKIAAASAPLDVSGTMPSGYWSVMGAGVLCGLVGATSLSTGYMLGAGFGLKHKGIDRSSSR